MFKGKYRINLRIKLMGIFLLLSISPVMAVSYFTFISSENYFKQNIVDSLQGLSQIKSQRGQGKTI